MTMWSTAAKRLSVAVPLILAAQVASSAQSKPLTAPEAAIAAVDKTWAEFYQSCNIDGMNRLIADDMVFVHIGGNMQTKKQFVDTVRPCTMERVQTEVSSVRIYGNTAIVIGTMNYQVKNMAPGVILYTRVYLNDGAGKWSLVTHESTAVAPRSTK